MQDLFKGQIYTDDCMNKIREFWPILILYQKLVNN